MPIVLLFLLVIISAMKAHTTPSINILVYSDDANFTNLEDRPPLVALRNLGYTSYTAYSNFNDFKSALTTGGPWDLVIYNEENWAPDVTVYDALYSYLASGGKVIVTTWRMDDYPLHSLWAELGVSYSDTLTTSGDQYMYLWSPTHSIFTTPNTLPNPLKYNKNLYGVDGFFVDALSGATALAGNTTTPQAGKAIIVVRNDGKAIFNGVLTGCMNLDHDGDGKTEAVELWENEIAFILGAIRPPVGGIIVSQDIPSSTTPSSITPILLATISASALIIIVAKKKM